MTAHRISYAYPSSPMARKLGRNAKGCYVAQIGAALTAHDTYAAALAYVAPMGTSPERWSIDHPENARFAPA